MKESQKRCLGTSTESFTGSSVSEQIIRQDQVKRNFPNEIGIHLPGLASMQKVSICLKLINFQYIILSEIQ